ncbi:MAG: beta-glucanase, partial [Bacteroidetes bacterium]|nr:beta-glucanase [Bacteroidota bacterium]
MTSSDNDNLATDNVDTSLLCLKQSVDCWNGSEAVLSMKIASSEKKDTVINLNLALYQNRVADKDANVDLMIDKDSLATLISNAEKGSLYEKAKLLPDSYYELSSNQLSMKAGEKKGSSLAITIHKDKLLADDIVRRNGKFVLPVKIQNSTSYTINNKVNSLMLVFKFADFDETKPDPAIPES